MRKIFETLFALMAGAAIGLGMTYYALSHDTAFGSSTMGSWTMQRDIGTVNANPYGRASIAHLGHLPIALGDGVSLIAKTDDDGNVLDGRCDVVVTGITPPARFWTLTLYAPSGDLVANSIDRYGFTSQEIVRQTNGDFSIIVRPRVSAGNWLPTGGIERYILILRLYDTPVGATTTTDHKFSMPALSTRNCP
jgi:hypothetical protein